MSFEVVFTDEASVQTFQIQDWIAERSVEGAIAWQRALRLAVGKLRERGSAFSLAAESPQFSESRCPIEIEMEIQPSSERCFRHWVWLLRRMTSQSADQTKQRVQSGPLHTVRRLGAGFARYPG